MCHLVRLWAAWGWRPLSVLVTAVCWTLEDYPVYCGRMLSHSVVSHSLRPHGLWPDGLFCLWDFQGKNTGVGCHFLFQRIFPIQGSNPSLLSFPHWQMDSLPQSHLGSTWYIGGVQYLLTWSKIVYFNLILPLFCFLAAKAFPFCAYSWSHFCIWHFSSWRQSQFY